MNRLLLIKKCIVLLILSILFSCLSVFAASEDKFESQIFSFHEKVIGCFPLEFDHIGGDELLLFYQDDKGERHLNVYKRGTGRQFLTKAIAELTVPLEVFGAQIINIDADLNEELLLLAFDAVYLVEIDENSQVVPPRKIASFERLFSIPVPDFICEIDFIFDLNSDGSYEMVLPHWRGAKLLAKQGDSYVELHQFHVNLRSKHVAHGHTIDGYPVTESVFRLPRIAVHDLNTDRAKDIFIESGRGLEIYFQTGDLQFPIKPDKRIPVRGSFKEKPNFTGSGLADLNNDGLIDYCRVFSHGNGYDTRTLIEVFLGNIQDGYSSRPSKRIVIEELALGLSLVDLDGNGSASLVVATTKVGITRMVKSLLVKRIPLELKIFEVASGVIDERPTATKSISCGLKLFGERLPARYLSCIAADIDGDNIRELVTVDDDDELQVYKGARKPVFSDKPVTTIKTNGVRLIKANNFDHDNKDDLILHGRDEDGNETITILWSR